MPPPRNRTRYISRIVAAFLITLSGTRLRKKCAESFLRNTDKAEENRTAMVVVFIPPAVEPGEPPISIRMIISISPVSVSRVRSAVLNPAVLGVTDWNREVQILSPRGRPENSQKEVNSRNCNQNSSNSQNNFTLHIIFFKLQFIFLNICPGNKAHTTCYDQSHDRKVYKRI